MNFVAEEMNQFRNDRVELLWRKIFASNPSNSGTVPYSTIKSAFIPSRHPQVKSRSRSELEVLAEFENAFLSFHKMNDLDEKAPVSKQEFFDFFQLVSATYSSDFSFNEYMVDPWNVDL